MKSLHSFAIAIPLATAMLFAQAPSQDPPEQPQRQRDQPRRQSDPALGQSQSDPGVVQPDQPQRRKRSAEQTHEAGQSDTSRTIGQADLGSTKTFSGIIVDANCSPASALSSSSVSSAASSSSTSADSTSTQTTSTETTANGKKSSASATKRDILKHCKVGSGTTSYALVTDDGTFLKLDETGNNQVMSQMMGGTSTSTSGSASTSKKHMKNMKASVTGSVEGDMLKVQSLTKM